MKTTVRTLILTCGLTFSALGYSQSITKTELKDKIAGAWIGQMIGNIYGLPYEFKFIDTPADEKDFPLGYNLDKLRKFDGAFSDDDTDIEYLYLLMMSKYGVEPSYEQIAQGWKHHIRDGVWLANRGSLTSMHHGFTPPFTGMKNHNPHWFQIDPQLINEIWGYTAPGMPLYAAQKSAWAARVTSDDWAITPTMLYGALYANAFFEKDVRKLLEVTLKQFPKEDLFIQNVKQIINLYDTYPADWAKARSILTQRYYYEEPEQTRTIFNANLNGLCGILAMLYGKGEFQRTLDLCCGMGFDCDNQAATIMGILGVMHGASALPKALTRPIDTWNAPFNNRYINVTRYDLPDAKIDDIIETTYEKTLEIVRLKGGKVYDNRISINRKATFTPPLEFSVGPAPDLEVGKEVDYSFSCVTNSIFQWDLLKGTLPEGLSFSNGTISGVPVKAGVYPITLRLRHKTQQLDKPFELLVKMPNLSHVADTIYANVRELNREVLDSCWITFHKSMYASRVDVLRDGIKQGPGASFFTLAEKSKLPKIDYIGYGWSKPQTISKVQLNMGVMEEFGGWFTSLNIQYLDKDNRWTDVGGYQVTPKLPETGNVYYQPHYAEYLFRFTPVQTRGIRVLMDATVVDSWHPYTNSVSSFISVSELGVYEK
ncbi:MAG: ADP-ribosylglycohydrolase family protein [Bacteroidales bacterium]